MSGPSRRIRLTLPVSVTTEKLLTVMRRQDNKLYLRGEVFWNSNVYTYGDLLSVLSAYGFGGAADASNGYGHAVSTFQLVGMAEGSGEPILLYSDGNAEGYSFAKGETPWSVKMELPQSLFSTASSEPAEAINSSGQFTATMQGVAMPSKELVFGYGQTLGEFEGYLLSDGPADAKDVFGSVRGYLVGSLNPGSDSGLAIVLTGIGEGVSTAMPVAQTTESVGMFCGISLMANGIGGVRDTYTVSFVSISGDVLHQQMVIEGESWSDPVANELITAPTKQPTVSHTFEFSGWSKTEGGPVESGGQTVLLEERAMTGFASDSEFGGVYTRFAAFGTDVDAFSLVLGKTYKVLWDDVWYEVVAQDASSFSPGALLLGNGAMLGLSDTGEPFGIGWLEGYAMMLAAVDGSTSESHTVGVYQGVTEDFILYPAFEEKIRHYEVRFYNGATLLQTHTAGYGTMVSYSGETPIDPTGEGVLTGWDVQITDCYGGVTDGTYNGGVIVTGNVTAYALFGDPWDAVLNAVNDGTYATKYSVGDSIPLNLGDLGFYTMEIAAIDVDAVSDGTTAHISFIAKELLPNTVQFSSDTGDIVKWSVSTLRSYLSDIISTRMDSTLYDRILEVIKTHRTRISATKTSSESTVDRIWIPARTEISGGIYAGLFVDEASRIKSPLGDTKGQIWWNREGGPGSMVNYSEKKATVTTDTGSVTYYPQTSYYYTTFGFCI